MSRPSLHPAHDGAPRPKGPPTHRRTRNRAPPGRSRRTHRPGRAPAPSSHGRPATQSLSSRAWCKPLPTRDCQLNPTLTHTDEHNSPGEAPEGRAPQHEAESAPGWTGQQRRSTRNRRGVTTVPASVSLVQVMMPTNPEMLQRSAERAQQYKAVQHELDDQNIPNKGLSVPPSSPIAKCASADLQRYKSQPSPSHRSAPSPTHPTANVPERENVQLNMPPFISARA